MNNAFVIFRLRVASLLGCNLVLVHRSRVRLGPGTPDIPGSSVMIHASCIGLRRNYYEMAKGNTRGNETNNIVHRHGARQERCLTI